MCPTSHGFVTLCKRALKLTKKKKNAFHFAAADILWYKQAQGWPQYFITQKYIMYKVLFIGAYEYNSKENVR